MSKHSATFAIFHSRDSIDRAVNALKNAGFRDSDISVLFPDRQSSQDFAHEKATKAPEGAATGTATGALLGGTLGWLVGIGSLAIPGIGPVIAAGPIMAALAGAGVGGAMGGITGALIGVGIPEYEAKRYEGMVKDGGILVSVHCDDNNWIKLAKDIFKVEHGEGIASSTEASSDTARSPTRSEYDREVTTTPPSVQL